MKKGSQRAYHCRYFGVGLACLAIFAFCGVVKAEYVVSAYLTISPPVAKPGYALMFRAEVYNNPNFTEPVGTRMRICVVNWETNWVSDKIDIVYPKQGSVYAYFKNGFAIPANAMPGKVYGFSLVYGSWWPLSNKTSVRVPVLRKKNSQ